jgi:hypothetical protein
MIRYLLIALFIYLLYKLIRGPRPNKKRNVYFRFGGFQKNKKSDRNLDQIEDAEFEDITNKEKKTGHS